MLFVCYFNQIKTKKADKTLFCRLDINHVHNDMWFLWYLILPCVVLLQHVDLEEFIMLRWGQLVAEGNALRDTALGLFQLSWRKWSHQTVAADQPTNAHKGLRNEHKEYMGDR